MTPDEFRKIGTDAEATVGTPLREKLKRTEEELRLLQQADDLFRRFASWHRFLTNGETRAGFLGSNDTFAMFVRSYRLDAVPAERYGRLPRLAEVELVVIPEALVAHDLRVCIPSKEHPGCQTVTSAPHGPQEIAARILTDLAAENVAFGTFDDVLREPCGVCSAPALVVAMDEYLDDDNGRDFIVGRLCGTCMRVHEVGSYQEDDPRDRQYSRTDGIYRRKP